MGLLPCSSQHTAAQHQETLRHCHESGPRNVLHLIPALDCPQCPLVCRDQSGAGAGTGPVPMLESMPCLAHHSTHPAVVRLMNLEPQHHRTTAPQHHSATLITVFCLQGQVRRWWWRRVCGSRGEEDRFPGFSDRAQPAPAPAAGCSGRVTSRVQ